MTTPINIDGIPRELKDLDQWVMWKLEKRPEQDKPAKVLYTINNVRADTTDITTWSNFEECVKALETGTFNGIGFVFSYYDDYLGIDWDDVRNPETGVFDQEIYQEIINMGSYAEISQSGKGAHVICKGKKPGKRCRSGRREMYDKDRFFVMTGNHLEGTPSTINEAPPEAIKAIYDKIELPRKTGDTSHKEGMEKSPLEDRNIISMLRSSAIADKFKSLWSGSAVAYPSNSEADLALANYIAFYTQDEVRIEGLMRQSGLIRDKWDSHPTYLKSTIRKAIDDLSERYTPSKGEGRKLPEQPVIEDIIQAYPKEVREAAYDILQHGDPAQYIRATVGRRHVGDESVIWSCLVAGPCIFISNTRGLHIAINGDKGTGKSNASEKWAETLPPRLLYFGSMSAKSMYYDNQARPRMIRVLDDVSLNDDQIDTTKKMCSNFQKETYHTTVVNGKAKHLCAPERQVLVMNYVSNVDDEQILDRFLLVSTEDDTMHCEAVANAILESEVKRFKETDHDIQVCRCMIDILSSKDYEILIPFSTAIKFADKRNARNMKKFLDMIRSCCLYKVFQREERSGVCFTTVEDFDRAAWIYSMSAGSNATQLTKKELEYLQYFVDGNSKVDYIPGKGMPAKITIQELVSHFKVGTTAVRNILHGKDGRSGLLNKVQMNVETVDVSSDDREWHRVNYYSYYGTEDFSLYAKFAIIDQSNLEKCIERFFEELDRPQGDTTTPHTPQEHPSITYQKVIDETTTVNTTLDHYHPKTKKSIVVEEEEEEEEEIETSKPLTPQEHPSITSQKVIDETTTVNTTLDRYHPKTKKSIVVEEEEEEEIETKYTQKTPVGIFSFSGERVTLLATKADDSV